MIRTVEAKLDAFTREDRPTKNFKDTPYLNLNGTAGEQRLAFIYFRPPFDRGSDVNVVNAVLRFRLRGSGWAGGPHTVTARRVDASWKEGSLTHDDQPAVAGTSPTVQITGGSEGDLVELDVTDHLQAFAAGSKFFGIRLEVNTAGGKRIHSTETVGRDDDGSLLTPELTVEWNRAPSKPTDPRPSGGRAIAVPKPLYAWDYHSALGEDSQAQSQVQVATVSDFSATVYDTGWVANLANEWRHDGADLTPATTYFWRVRVQDESGRISEYSDAASFVYTAQPVLTVLTGATVDDPTPTITWTFAGQKFFSYVLYQSDGAGGWTPIWRSGKTKSTAGEVTIPKNLLRHEGVDYRGRIRAWDTNDREATADKDYVQAFHVFQYVRSGVPAVVTNLQAAVDGPAILLTWDRAAQPDHYAVKVDGEIVEARIDAADVLVAGTSYSYRFYGARPGGNRTIGVEAVAAGKHSDPVEAVVAYDVAGVWLIHEQTGTEVVVHGDAPDSVIGRSAARHNLVGSRSPVVLTDSVRGYEGSVAGVMVNYLGVTAKTWRNRFEKIVGLADRGDLRMVYLDYSFRVVLDEDDPDLHAADGLVDAFEVGFGFAQVADFTFRSRV